MVSRQAEMLGEIIRMHLVGMLAERRRQCLKCGVTPESPDAEMICSSCAEVAGNELGRQIELDIVHKLGGARMMIPTLKCLETQAKHRQIRNRFTGANHKELALQFGYSIPAIYDILRKKEPDGEI